MRLTRSLAWLLAAAVLLASFMPVSSIAIPSPLHTDKLVHALMYGSLALVFMRAYPRCSLIFLGSALLCYGCLIEVGQYFLPYRSASIGDALANLAGIAAVFSGHLLTQRRTQLRYP